MATARRLGRFVALDFAAEMLRETLRRAEDAADPPFDVVRADVARLPSDPDSVDFVLAGAAIHCWPCPQDGLAEVRRVLRPRGRFFATAFLKNATFLARSALGSGTAGPCITLFRFYEENELRRLFLAAGFANVDIEDVTGA
jgi:ubiquinone/menaquinone biosynthesis C-methylase UbiE